MCRVADTGWEADLLKPSIISYTGRQLVDKPWMSKPPDGILSACNL
ncbi:unnamed protein product, partial [Ascophyllum nodosum]